MLCLGNGYDIYKATEMAKEIQKEKDLFKKADKSR